MASETDRSVKCNCGAAVDEAPGAPLEDRKPCPECGELGRQVSLVLAAVVKVRGGIRMKGRHGQPGEVAPHIEQRDEPSFWRKGQKWVQRYMRIDRENDRYEEIVKDLDTGEEIHRSEERLSEHRGHGSARKRD